MLDVNSEAVRAALEDAAYEVGKGLRSYSGRGMFGRECVAITGDISVALGLVAEVAQSTDFGGELAYVLADGCRTDSMGLDTVFFWPQIPAWDALNDRDD